MIGHLIDGERVFGHRAFCFSRGELAHVPSFDENEYVAASRSNDRTRADLVAELTLVRQSNLTVFERLPETDWKRLGTASDYPVTGLALALIMAGHVRHHFDILQTRYG